MPIYHFASGVLRKDYFETSGTIPIIVRRTAPTINPINAIRASVATTVCYTFIGFAYGTCFTIWFIASVATTVCYTFICFALCACFTIWFIASVATTVCYTFICFASGA
jgi:hypothetical protein